MACTDDWLKYDLPAYLIPRLWGGKYRGQRQLWYLLKYHGRDDQIDIETRHAEFSSWRWMGIDELPDYIVPFKVDVYTAVINAFKDLSRADLVKTPEAEGEMTAESGG